MAIIDPNVVDNTDDKTRKLADSVHLAELLLDPHQAWQVHNCKVLRFECDNDGTLPFIYHYDRLFDEEKGQYPLKGKLLVNFNKQMTAQQACKTIGVAVDRLDNPQFIKITGKIVVFHEPLQLAIRLLWSNTSKPQDTMYCKDSKKAIEQSMQGWQFVGNVDTLYKGGADSVPIVAGVNDEMADLVQASYFVPISSGYQTLPKSIGLDLLANLHDNKQYLDWIEQAIFARVL